MDRLPQDLHLGVLEFLGPDSQAALLSTSKVWRYESLLAHVRSGWESRRRDLFRARDKVMRGLWPSHVPMGPLPMPTSPDEIFFLLCQEVRACNYVLRVLASKAATP